MGRNVMCDSDVTT